MQTVFFTLASVIAAIYLINIFRLSHKDSTDAGKDRSGLCLYTDHGTGVQYVGTITGAITPRLNADGTIMKVNTND